MPKPMRVSIEVEEIALGSVMRLLNRTRGVVRFNFDLRAEERADENGAANGARPARGGSQKGPGSRALWLAATAAGPCKATSLVPVFAQYGLAKGSIGSTAHVMEKAGLLKRVDQGVYALTEKGAELAASNGAGAAAGTRADRGTRAARGSAREVAIEYLRENGGGAHVGDIAARLQERGLSPLTIRKVLDRMRSAGEATRPKKGFYALTNKGKAASADVGTAGK